MSKRSRALQQQAANPGNPLPPKNDSFQVFETELKSVLEDVSKQERKHNEDFAAEMQRQADT